MYEVTSPFLDMLFMYINVIHSAPNEARNMTIYTYEPKIFIFHHFYVTTYAYFDLGQIDEQ
jgi:hypothetical protein